MAEMAARAASQVQSGAGCGTAPFDPLVWDRRRFAL